MIIKSISHTSARASIKNLIAYVFGDQNMENELGEAVSMSSFLIGNRTRWSEQFQRVEARRRSFYAGRETRIFHEILSFHPDSKPSAQELSDLMWKYVQFRVNDKPVLAFGAVHFSESHYHAHMVIQGVDMYGTSIRMSKSDFRNRVQVRLNEYQNKTYPHLSVSIIDYTQPTKDPQKLHAHSSWQRKERTNERPRKERVHETVQLAFIDSDSLEAFIANLALKNIETYHRRGLLTGVIFEGTKFRLRTSLGIDFEQLLKRNLKQERMDRITALKASQQNTKSRER